MMIDKPLPDTDAWVLSLAAAELPVLRRTAETLDAMRDDRDNINARSLAFTILQDPLLTLRVFACLAERRRKSQHTDITTLEQALMMMGIGPFFETFQQLPLVEDHLKSSPKSLLGLLRVVNRARHASQWARDWAIHRHDLNADEITIAALLHDIAEMLMWCFAPQLALRVDDMKAADPQLRSSSAQVGVFGITLLDLQQALIHYWGLPELLAMLMDHTRASNPRIRNVSLAVDLARHSANGWHDAAIPDDLTGIQELLRIGPELLPRHLGVAPETIAHLVTPT